MSSNLILATLIKSVSEADKLDKILQIWSLICIRVISWKITTPIYWSTSKKTTVNSTKWWTLNIFYQISINSWFKASKVKMKYTKWCRWSSKVILTISSVRWSTNTFNISTSTLNRYRIRTTDRYNSRYNLHKVLL